MEHLIRPVAISTANMDWEASLRKLPNYSLAMRLARSTVYVWAWLSQFLNGLACSIAT